MNTGTFGLYMITIRLLSTDTLRINSLKSVSEPMPVFKIITPSLESGKTNYKIHTWRTDDDLYHISWERVIEKIESILETRQPYFSVYVWDGQVKDQVTNHRQFVTAASRMLENRSCGKYIQLLIELKEPSSECDDNYRIYRSNHIQGAQKRVKSPPLPPSQNVLPQAKKLPKPFPVLVNPPGRTYRTSPMLLNTRTGVASSDAPLGPTTVNAGFRFLKAMGYTHDEQTLRNLIQMYKGNLSHVIEHLESNQNMYGM
ncbi:unnamed protein product [Calicophoron daubneyi]|uniref:UBA domain-containing protein n=1 Tax=Calicophoron daubneyi TaxID=300641 RepID=A0AAV2TM27_CALDB